MNLKCIFGFHTWDKCKCKGCGVIRHDWSGCLCVKCNKADTEKLAEKIIQSLIIVEPPESYCKYWSYGEESIKVYPLSPSETKTSANNVINMIGCDPHWRGERWSKLLIEGPTPASYYYADSSRNPYRTTTVKLIRTGPNEYSKVVEVSESFP